MDRTPSKVIETHGLPGEEAERLAHKLASLFRGPNTEDRQSSELSVQGAPQIDDNIAQLVGLC